MRQGQSQETGSAAFIRRHLPDVCFFQVQEILLSEMQITNKHLPWELCYRDVCFKKRNQCVCGAF